jgi:site-specific DNA-methyltransferase (adenine-specific)
LSGEQVDRGDWGIAKQQFTHGQRDTNYDETASATRLGKLEPTTDEAKEWNGWGTALKPAHEPIVLARKPLDGTVANNVLTYGVGGINIDGCRGGEGAKKWVTPRGGIWSTDSESTSELVDNPLGRFPANFIHDGSDEVLELFPSIKADESAARFFYCAKASKKDRNEGLDGFAEKRPDERTTTGMGTFDEKGVAKQANHHPTVKPTDLMRYLCRLITPPNGTVLDPFTGSGSTGKAAVLEGFNFIGIEQSAEYIEIAKARIEAAR